MAETTTESTEAAGGHATVFPPFDATTFGSQLLWLAITFGLLYYLMSKIVLPRIASILEERNDRIADDLAEAEKLKQETDAAIAAYEQALAEAKHNAHAIAQEARDKSKRQIDAARSTIESDLEAKMTDAETRIAKVKSDAMTEVDTIARDTAAALVDMLIGSAGKSASKGDVSKAVDAVLAERKS